MSGGHDMDWRACGRARVPHALNCVSEPCGPARFKKLCFKHVQVSKRY
jgi:hypothetical protein